MKRDWKGEKEKKRERKRYICRLKEIERQREIQL